MALNLIFNGMNLKIPGGSGGYLSIEQRFLMALDKLYHPEKHRSIEREYQKLFDKFNKKSDAV